MLGCWTNKASSREPCVLYYCAHDSSWTGYITGIQAATITNSNGNMFNVMKAPTKFSGTDPLMFEDWYENTCTVISLTRPEIFELMEGRTWPTTGSTGEGADAALALK